MPNQVEAKAVDPEAELSNVMRRFQNLAPECSIAKKALGVPQLKPQEKQISILKHEMAETKLCIKLAKKGQHAVRDENTKQGIHHSIIEYENFDAELRDENAQLDELSLLNYLAGKVVGGLRLKVPTESDEIASLENAYNRLRRIENKLDLTTKRFCLVNSANKSVREEIHRLLVERKSFNIQWQWTINNLMKGKEYLMDILEIATNAFGSRDDACRILDTLKWKGLFKLNKDIAEMQSYDSELNHLAKLEEFLRVKGSKRLCEADEKEEIKRLDEIARCEHEIARHDDLLEAIFNFAGTENVGKITDRFSRTEIENFSRFVLLCEVLQESIFLRKELDLIRLRIMDQHDINQAREEKQDKRLAQEAERLNAQRIRTQHKLIENENADALFNRVLKGIDEICKLAKCDLTPLLTLLGNHREVNNWNVDKFISILEVEVKSLIQVVYGAVKPPAPTPTKGKGAPAQAKLIADPCVETIRPNRIENLVPYQPCAYCVEDYMMNQVFETPAVPATKEYVASIFRLEGVNTKFEIFTLTVPAKRHPYRGGGD